MVQGFENTKNPLSSTASTEAVTMTRGSVYKKSLIFQLLKHPIQP